MSWHSVTGQTVRETFNPVCHLESRRSTPDLRAVSYPWRLIWDRDIIPLQGKHRSAVQMQTAKEFGHFSPQELFQLWVCLSVASQHNVHVLKLANDWQSNCCMHIVACHFQVGLLEALFQQQESFTWCSGSLPCRRRPILSHTFTTGDTGVFDFMHR